MNSQLKTPAQLVESTEFLAWCGKWFGGDSDEEYLSRAVVELYLPAILAAQQPEPNGWRCFHCGANFEENEAAAAVLHFGTSEHDVPACQISIEHVRWMEAQNRRAVDEDTEALRAVRSLVNEHETLRRRAEEQGYARGLADAKKHPEELGLIAAAPQPKQDYLDTPIDWDLNGVPYTRKQAILDHCGPLALSYIEHAILYYAKD